MARLVRHESTDPIKIDPKTLNPDKPIFICACGLSQNFPFCDGSHKPCRTSEAAGKVYIYDKARKTVIREEEDQP